MVVFWTALEILTQSMDGSINIQQLHRHGYKIHNYENVSICQDCQLNVYAYISISMLHE